MHIKAVVGRNVRRYRELKGISQEELAFDADLHRTYVSGVERGVRNPTVLIVAKLANALGIAPCKLLEFNDNP
ncbi:MAG: helix-turn-helix transcriptional regulator [Rhodobacteraceae bacterium]|nr:helix-turn-helix transcriptional regulator [Paracoccaceae bacterium]